MKKPKPGDFGLSIIGGSVGYWVGIGQHLIGDGSRYTHAFVVLDDNTVMEAMPKGARIASLNDYMGKAVFSKISLTAAQREAIVAQARKLEKTPYSFLDYLALALANYNVKTPKLRKYIENKGHMICSQLVDYCYQKAGVHLFNDNRLPQDVTPGDLANMLIERDWL